MTSRSGLLALAALFASCNTQQDVGTRYLKTMALTTSQGGTFSVDSSESAELAGLSLVVPAGALPADTTLTLELGLDDIVSSPASPAGPVAILGPELAFLRDVELRMPAAQSHQGSVEETELWRSDSAGVQKLRTPKLSYDAVSHTATAALRSTGSLQVALVAASDCSCGPGVADPICPCGPSLGTPSCTCSDGSLGCNTGRCIRGNAAGNCSWEVRVCP